METVTVIVPMPVTVILIGSCKSRFCSLDTETGRSSEVNDEAESPSNPSAVTIPRETTGKVRLPTYVAAAGPDTAKASDASELMVLETPMATEALAVEEPARLL